MGKPVVGMEVVTTGAWLGGETGTMGAETGVGVATGIGIGIGAEVGTGAAEGLWATVDTEYLV